MATKQLFVSGNLLKFQCTLQQARRSLVVYSTNLNKEKMGAQSPVTQSEDYEAPGLSEACVTTNEPVGPGATKSGEYKVPEYFNFNKMSYFEAEVEMQKYRLEPPSALKQ